MNGPMLSDAESICRYCKPTSLDEEGKPTAAAFMMRKDETFLSANWIGYFGATSIEDSLIRIRDTFRAKNFKFAANAKFALLSVGATISHVFDSAPDHRRLTIRSEPVDPDDPSHCGVHGYSHEDDLIAELIAECVYQLEPARG